MIPDILRKESAEDMRVLRAHTAGRQFGVALCYGCHASTGAQNSMRATRHKWHVCETCLAGTERPVRHASGCRVCARLARDPSLVEATVRLLDRLRAERRAEKEAFAERAQAKEEERLAGLRARLEECRKGVAAGDRMASSQVTMLSEALGIGCPAWLPKQTPADVATPEALEAYWRRVATAAAEASQS